MQWYYAQNGVQKGPVPEEELMAMVAAGRVRPDELVWRDGMPSWAPAGTVAELRLKLEPGVPPAAPVFAPPPGNPYQPPTTTAYGSAHYGGPIPNYLWQSIVVTILCCWPFGIPAIVYAAKVDSLVAMQDYAGARHASDQAKMWCWISFACLAVPVAIYLILMALGLVAGVLSSANG